MHSHTGMSFLTDSITVILAESTFNLKLNFIVLAQVCTDDTDAGSYRYLIHTHESGICSSLQEFG